MTHSSSPGAVFAPALHPHRRTNILTGENVLVSPHRARRPWRGADEPTSASRPDRYDPHCHLCPGNARATGERNPEYGSVFVFGNDFAALQRDTPDPAPSHDALFVVGPAQGCARVICFSPDHGASLPLLPAAAMRDVVDAWCAESAALGAIHRHVQVFENKGAMMGCSNPHPHGQIWATDYVPDEVLREDLRQRAYFDRHGRPMLLDLAEREAARGERVVLATDRWLVIVPFWAAWPFETLVLPRFPVARLPELDDTQRDDLVRALQRLTTRYDNLFGCSFPYSMGWHGAPFDAASTDSWQLHAHFFPPLLRSASVRKFMVGFELLAEAQRDITPEQAAAQLRSASERHYLCKDTAE